MAEGREKERGGGEVGSGGDQRGEVEKGEKETCGLRFMAQLAT